MWGEVPSGSALKEASPFAKTTHKAHTHPGCLRSVRTPTLAFLVLPTRASNHTERLPPKVRKNGVCKLALGQNPGMEEVVEEEEEQEQDETM